LVVILKWSIWLLPVVVQQVKFSAAVVVVVVIVAALRVNHQVAARLPSLR